MKLISCHIENFGSIKKRDITFNEGVTSFCEKNGYGKTTIAAFLKAMFYGMDSTRKNGKFNDRVHYFPFSGGLFGGNVVFSCNDKIYKIERFFDETSDTRDKLNVYCNNEKCDNPDYSIGEEIFGINKESFERTIFITSSEIEFSSTDSINTKLNNFAAGCDDDISLFAAIEKLEKKKKEYKKQKQGGGLVDETTQKINGLKERIANYKTISEGLSVKYLSLNSIEKQLNVLIDKYNKAQKTNLLISHWEQYDRFLAEINDIQLRIDTIEKKYIFGIPSKDELDTLGEKVVMDANFNVRFEQNGIERSEGHLSSGQKSICALCFRLALMENMYSKEKPFLILDDPFVFLDEQNCQKVRELLSSLTAYFQIIYFTCHTVRKI